MKKKLFFQALIKVLSGALIVGLLVFLSVGTTEFWNGWLFMGLLFIPMFIAGIVMFFKSPALLKRRLNAKEENDEQKQVILFSGLMFILGFLLAGFNYRYDWISIPDFVVIIASIVFLISYALYAEILRENEFLSRTIEVQENQRVIDTGFYGKVRHPMYTITIFLFLSMPLILGSIISFLVFLIYPLIIVKRIKNEKKYLEENLPGYMEYKEKVKYKLIPFIW